MSPELKRTMETYYDQRAPEYDDWYERRGRYRDPRTDALWAEELAKLDEWADEWGSGRVLEIACGTGRWTAHLAARPEVTEVVAVDASEAMLEECRRKVRAGAEKVRWVLADAYDLPFGPGEFDALFTGFFLSHVPPERAGRLLESYTSLLRPGGEAGLYDSLLPDGAEPVQVQRRALRDGSEYDVLKVYYTADTLRELLSRLDPGARTWDTGRFFVAGRWRRPR